MFFYFQNPNSQNGGEPIEGWTLAQNSLSTGSYPTTASHTSNQFILGEVDLNQFSMYEVDIDGNFSKVGNSFDVSTIPEPTAQAISNADSVFKVAENVFVWVDHNSDNLVPLIWDGNDFSVGNIANLGDTSGYANGSYLGGNTACLWFGNNSSIRVIKKIQWDGSDLSVVGNELNIGSNLYTHPVGMSENRVALVGTGTDNVQAYDFDGSDWSPVGNPYAFTALAGIFGGAKITDNSISIYVGSSPNIQTIVFDGSDWTTQGTAGDTGTTNGSVNPRWQSYVEIGGKPCIVVSRRVGDVSGVLELMVSD